jgi:hypothetical protein
MLSLTACGGTEPELEPRERTTRTTETDNTDEDVTAVQNEPATAEETPIEETVEIPIETNTSIFSENLTVDEQAAIIIERVSDFRLGGTADDLVGSWTLPREAKDYLGVMPLKTSSGEIRYGFEEMTFLPDGKMYIVSSIPTEVSESDFTYVRGTYTVSENILTISMNEYIRGVFTDVRSGTLDESNSYTFGFIEIDGINVLVTEQVMNWDNIPIRPSELDPMRLDTQLNEEGIMTLMEYLGDFLVLIDILDESSLGSEFTDGGAIVSLLLAFWGLDESELLIALEDPEFLSEFLSTIENTNSFAMFDSFYAMLVEFDESDSRDLITDFWSYADKRVWENHNEAIRTVALAKSTPNPTFNIDFSRTSFQQYVAIVREADPIVQTLLVTGMLAMAVVVFEVEGQGRDPVLASAIGGYFGNFAISFCKTMDCTDVFLCSACGMCSRHCSCGSNSRGFVTCSSCDVTYNCTSCRKCRTHCNCGWR